MTARTTGAIALGGSVTVVCVLPAFLVAALVVPLQRELRFGPVALGLAIAAYRGTGALTSPFLGPVADRLGAGRAMRLAAGTAAVAMTGIAVTADRWAVLTGWLVLAGCANGLGQPGANRLLSEVVRADRLGFAFGIKQSAPPLASMLAGASVPLVSLTLGWRWAYVMGAGLALVVAARVGTVSTSPGRGRRRAVRRSRTGRAPGLLFPIIALGLGTASSSAVTTFFVDAAVDAGHSESVAGTVLAVASVTAIVVRVSMGWTADRLRSRHLLLCAGLLGVGAAGMAVLAVADPAWFAAAGILAVGGTWGFNGVFVFALVRTHPDEPGRITGAVMPGALLGGMAGPVVVGAIVDGAGYPTAWAVAAALAALASLGMARSAGRPALAKPATRAA